MGRQFRQILPHEGFAAGKEEHRGAEGGQVVDHGFGLGRGEFVRLGRGFGSGVAVDATQVAAPGHVPDHHGFLVRRELEQVRGQGSRVAAVAEGVRGFRLTAVEFGDTDHRVLSPKVCVSPHEYGSPGPVRKYMWFGREGKGVVCFVGTQGCFLREGRFTRFPLADTT